MTATPAEPSHGAYLDHAATTPMSPAALEAFVAELAQTGNPSSLHAAGRAARRVVEESREAVAAALGARPSEVIFTAGGTESDNLAIKGLFWGRRTTEPHRRRILVSAVEHHAVLDPAFWMAEHTGAEIVLLPVDVDGRLDLDALRAELAAKGDEVALISVMWANNEVGTIQPVHEVVQIARPYGIPVHSDAVQAVGQVPVDFAESGLDALTLTGHKLGGPMGVGALIAKRGLPLTPVLHGGGQERGVRSGTLDTPAIRSFAVAVTEAVGARAERAEQTARQAASRDTKRLHDWMGLIGRCGGVPCTCGGGHLKASRDSWRTPREHADGSPCTNEYGTQYDAHALAVALGLAPEQADAHT